MITQNQLQLIQDLRECGRHYDALRTEVVALLTNASPIERGGLTAFLQTSSAQRLSWRIIEQELGRGAAAAFRLHVPITRSTQLIIQPAGQWSQSIQHPQSRLIRAPFDVEWHD